MSKIDKIFARSRSGDYIPRLIDAQIKERLLRSPIVLIEGPKWCGKTWSSAHSANSAVSLIEDAAQNVAQMDVGYVLSGEKPRLIDEWQEVPSVWDSARLEVDAIGRRGQYILTGSRAPRPEEIRHPGAGRVSRLRMNTMTLYESGESSGAVSLREVLDGSFESSECQEYPVTAVAEAIVRGGWPEVVANKGTASYPAGDYARDVIAQLAAYARLRSWRLAETLRSMARHESQPVAEKKIAEDLARGDGDGRLSPQTLKRYRTLLDRFYLVDPTPPLELNLRSSTRVIRRGKARFFDPSFTAALLGIKSPEHLISDPNTFGLLFESLCIRDLKAYAQCIGASVFYYRDPAGNEIDAVIQRDDGRWAAFEIKLSAAAADAAAEKLLKLVKGMPEGSKRPVALGVIVASARFAYRRKDGVYIIPITALKP